MYRISSLMLLCAVAACAAPQRQPPTEDDSICIAPQDHDFLPIRVGIEYLPPATEAAQLAPTPRFDPLALGIAPVVDDARQITVESLVPPGRLRSEPTSVALKLPWTFDRRDKTHVGDPAEQLTFQFVDDLIGEDHRRMQRELGAPVLTTRMNRLANGSLWNYFDEREHEDEARFLNSAARRLVRRPLRKALKSFTRFAEVESMLEDFKADNVPMSGAYQEQKRSGLGRLSMRLRIRDSGDPLEIDYINWGFRVGSSQEKLKLTYGVDLAEGLRANFWMNYGYDHADVQYRADLRYQVDEDTHLYMLLGDELQFMSGPTAYALVDTPIDGTPGILFYVEHLF